MDLPRPVFFGGERKLKFWLDRDQWLPYIDVLKMNLEEASASWFRKEYLAEAYEPELTADEMRQFATHCLDAGVKCLCITMDARGCMVYCRAQDGLQEIMVPAVPVSHVVDTTGCGDSFAGGLGFGLLQNSSDYISAVRYGNALGALRAQGKTFSVFKSLEDINEIIAQTYGEEPGR